MDNAYGNEPPGGNNYRNARYVPSESPKPSHGGYIGDRQWADTYTPEIRRIMKMCGDLICAPREIVINVAPDYEDRKQATDYVIQISAGAIACRLRRSNYKYRDWTIRHSRPGNIKTEEAKLLDGWGRWYLYGWTVDGKIPHWMLIDLDLARQNNALERGTIMTNPDGVQFRAIPHYNLEDCIARGYIDGMWVPWSEEDLDDGLNYLFEPEHL